jgi:hypothetical protein
MKQLLTTAVAALVLLLGHADHAFAQRWGRGTTPRTGACFYEDTDFRGRYFCAAPGQRFPSLPADMGDEISSIRTFGAAEVMVFKDRSFRGTSGRFEGNVADLKGRGWNDKISSIRVEPGRFYPNDRARERERPRPGIGGRLPQWGRGPMSRNGACFFEDSRFRGRYFCMDRGESFTSLPPGFNDRISSIRVFGRGVELFVNDEFRGRSTRVSRDAPNLGSSWGDKVSSIRVF